MCSVIIQVVFVVRFSTMIAGTKGEMDSQLC